MSVVFDEVCKDIKAKKKEKKTDELYQATVEVLQCAEQIEHRIDLIQIDTESYNPMEKKSYYLAQTSLVVSAVALIVAIFAAASDGIPWWGLVALLLVILVTAIINFILAKCESTAAEYRAYILTAIKDLEKKK